MRLLSNLHVKGKPAVLPDRAIRRQSHYFIYRPDMSVTRSAQNNIEVDAETTESTRKTKEKLDESYKEGHEQKKPK